MNHSKNKCSSCFIHNGSSLGLTTVLVLAKYLLRNNKYGHRPLAQERSGRLSLRVSRTTSWGECRETSKYSLWAAYYYKKGVVAVNWMRMAQAKDATDPLEFNQTDAPKVTIL